MSWFDWAKAIRVVCDSIAQDDAKLIVTSESSSIMNILFQNREIIEDQYRFSFKLFWNIVKGAQGLAFARSKGSNVNKAFDVGIIITSIRDNKSTIRVSNENYRSANEVNCTLYRSDIICCRMQRKFYGNNLMSSVL